MFHPKIILRIVGILLFIEAAFLLGSVGVSLFYAEDTVRPLLYSAGIIASVPGKPTISKSSVTLV